MRRYSLLVFVAIAGQVSAAGCGKSKSDNDRKGTAGLACPERGPVACVEGYRHDVDTCACVPDTANRSALADDVFGRPWVFIDQLKMDHPFDALVATPVGFVAISHAPTLDGRSMPSRNNIAAVSADGVSWEEHSLGPDIHGRGLAIGNGIIVLVGRRMGAEPRGVILVSGDGRRWEEVASPGGSLFAISFVRGRFHAFGEYGTFLTSGDGRIWQDHSRRELVQLNDVAFGNGRYVAVGNVSWLTSADGQTWTEHRSICGDVARCPGVVPPGGSPPGALGLFSVLFGNGVFVTQGSVGGWVSPDGLAWTEAPEVVGNGTYTAGRFMALTRQPDAVMVSEDGRGWSKGTSFLVSDQPIGCLGRKCVAMDDGILVVPNSGDPQPLPRLPELWLDRSANGQTQAVMVGQRIWVSLKTIGPGQYGDPVVSSGAVRFLDVRVPPGPPTQGGPSQSYRFLTETAGRAEVHIPHSAGNEAFNLTLDISPR
jgi:hypothetical protein